jgi:hypothetical protein
MKTALANWETFYSEGKSYHKTAQGSVRRPEVFTPGIIQNLAAMGIEKYFMAIFMHRGLLPRNHTMEDMLYEAKKLFPVDPELERILLYMDSLQAICSIEKFKITEPEKTDVPDFIKAIDMVAEIAEAECR